MHAERGFSTNWNEEAKIIIQHLALFLAQVVVMVNGA
jgi:hypothetical protein